MKLSKLGKLRQQAQVQLKEYHETMAKIEKLRKEFLKKKQQACPHTVTRLKSEPGYFEPGKMRAPLPDTVYRICSNCKLKLEVQVEGEPKFVKLEN